VIISIATLVSFFKDRQFAMEELDNWVETEAVVIESHISGEDFYSDSDTNSDGKVTSTYMRYSVNYEFTAEYETPYGLYEYNSGDSNSGKTNIDATEIPASAFEIPQPGDTVTILFNSANPVETRRGGKAHWQELAEFSLTNLILPLVFFLIALFFGYKDYKLNGFPRVKSLFRSFGAGAKRL
jgi:hypothetical protein